MKVIILHRKRAFRFVLLILLLNVVGMKNVNAQVNIEIGDQSATTGYLPYYTFFNHTLTQQIYKAEEIGLDGMIYAISFDYTGNQASDLTNTIDVYIKHTSKSLFEYNTDWESIDTSDLCYSGTFLIDASPGWKQIVLDTPFEYNGVDNLLVCFDNNTGTWTSTRNWYAYNTGDNRAIRIYSDETNYDPFNPTQYNGVLMTMNNHIILEVLNENARFISASANPSNAGTVIGGGAYELGEICTLTAIPNTGCTFINWTENGVVVSTEPEFSFSVTENRTLVANFQYPTTLADDFNDGEINSELWIATGNNVYEEDGLLKMDQNVTDQNVSLLSKPLSLGTDNRIVMERKFMVHRGSDYNYAGYAFEFNGDTGIHGVPLHADSWDGSISDEWGLDYIGIVYGYTYWENKFGIYVENGVGSEIQGTRLCDVVFDTWLTEKVEIDFTAGTFSYYLDNVFVTTIDMPELVSLDVNYYTTIFRPWGWWTGHQHYMDYILVNPEPTTLVANPNPIDLGYRPSGAWMRPVTVNISNLGSGTLINSISASNGFFVVEETPDLPLNLGYGESFGFEVGTSTGNGVINANLLVGYGDGQEAQFPMTATAYVPAVGDVWENPIVLNNFPYIATLYTANHPLYNNYVIPQADAPDGADVVYQMTFIEDTYLNASVTSGENGKVALYPEGFKGMGGPDLNNNYTKPALLSITSFGFEENLEGWTNIDADGDGHVWYHNSEAGNHGSSTADCHNGSLGCVNGESYCNNYGVLYPDNYLVSPEKYIIREGSSVSFWARTQDINYPYEHFGVAISTSSNSNPSDFTTIQEWTLTARGNGIPTRGTIGRDGNQLRETGNWFQFTCDLSQYAGEQVWVAIHHFNCYDQFIINLDDIELSAVSTNGRQELVLGNRNDMELTVYDGTVTNNRVHNSTPANQQNFIPKSTFAYTPANSDITNMTVTPGTYYLVASSTSDDWSVEINVGMVPCPEVAYNPVPANGETEIIPNSVALNWDLGDRTTSYRLLFGTDLNNMEVLVDWTRDLNNRYSLYGLHNNTIYYWRVDQRNDGCPEGVMGELWSFTTHLNVPNYIWVNNDQIFEGDGDVLYWEAPAERGLLSYNVYCNGELIGNTTETYYELNNLTYNMDGYRFNVTAVYDEGESDYSYDSWIYVSGYGSVEGYVYEQDGTTPIEGVTVSFNGYNDFGWYTSYQLGTDANGHYSGAAIQVGNYSVQASCIGYQPKNYGDVYVPYNENISDINFILDEQFKPVGEVVAEYYPDPDDPNSPYVKVYWSMNSSLVEDFETGDFNKFEWQLDPIYPWEITSNYPYEGDYCMRSNNHYYDGTTSAIQVDVVIPSDSYVGFFGRISSEGGWDFGHFYIDGWEQGSWSGESDWFEASYPVSAGTHTFVWSYTKDGSVSNGDDCFFVDNIRFASQERGERSFQHYRVYRTDEYNNSAFLESNTVVLSEATTDTLLIDNTWPEAEMGGYKFGVSRVYEGNRESGITSNALTKLQPVLTSTSRLRQKPTGKSCGDTRDEIIFSDGFENGMDNWTTIDVDGDGYDWVLGSNIGGVYLGNGASLAGSGHYGSYDMACSGSWSNVSSTVLYPDNYLVSPQLTLGGSFSFWACAQDVSYAADHFGVAVSTTSNYDPNNFTTIAEWTMTAKGIGAKTTATRSGNRDQGNWYQYTVDLSDYYGQQGYIAIRHFNCSDMFVLNVDDVELTTVSIPVQGPRESKIVWSNPMAKDLLISGVSVNVTLDSGDSPEGTVVSFVNQDYNEQMHHPVADVVLDGSGYYAWDWFRKGDYEVTVTKEGYTTVTEYVSIYEPTALQYQLEEIMTGISDLYVSRTGWAMWSGPSNDLRHLESISVILSDLSGNVLFSGETENDYMQLPVEGLVEGQTYHLVVGSVYSSGISNWDEVDWTYEPCDNYEGPLNLQGQTVDEGVMISWEYPEEEDDAKAMRGTIAYAFNLSDGQWISYDIAQPNEVNQLNPINLYGGAYCGFDGYVYATYDYNWYKIEYETGIILDEGYLGMYFYDCAWDYTTNTMYGMYDNTLYVWDIENNTTQAIGQTGMDMIVLACDLTGQLYGVSIGSPASLYRIDKTNAAIEFVGSTGQNSDWYWQSGVIDPITRKLYWANDNGYETFLAEVNLETGEANVLAYNTGTQTCLTVPYTLNQTFLGAMVYRDGELLGFTRGASYLDEDGSKANEYTVRIVYGGEAICPDENYAFSTSCPQTVDVLGPVVSQTTQFAEGWTWWSTFVNQERIDGLNLLEEGLGDNGMIIKSQTQFVQYVGGQWAGGMNDINNESMYMVQVSAPCTVSLTTERVEPEEHPITLYNGWNWVGYPSTMVMSLSSALSEYEPVDGDFLKSQTSCAYYYSDLGWIGSLKTLTPGMGLMYRSNSNNPVSFTYYGGDRSDEVEENITAEGNRWEPNVQAYPNNMSVMAVVELDDNELQSENYELAVFANGECRGSAKLMRVESLNRYIAFLTVYGEESSELYFGLYDTETGMTTFESDERLDFSTNSIVGSPIEPYVVHFRGTTGMDEHDAKVNVFPNPVEKGSSFRIDLPVNGSKVQIEIVNALGVVETCQGASSQTSAEIKAPEVAGVYTLRITVDGKRTYIRKLIVR